MTASPASLAPSLPRLDTGAGIGQKPISACSTPGPSPQASSGCPQPRTPLSIKPSARPAATAQRTALPSINKMAMSSVITPLSASEQPKMSMTSKEWVIPPRPKPGRKPATDTPPTKRKAQNRAAQRAFRERRAARVGELEEQLDQQREEQDRNEAELKDKIHELELDVQSFRSRCMLLENMLDRERQDRIRVETEAETLKRRLDEGVFTSNYKSRSLSSPRHPFDGFHSPLSQGPRHSLPDARPGDRHGHNFSISQIISPPDTLDMSSSNDDAITCGDCTPNGRCACAEEVLASTANSCAKCGLGSTCQCLSEAMEDINRSHELKRPVSPSAAVPVEKRTRSSTQRDVAEADFTSAFTRKTTMNVQPEQSFPPSSTLSQMSSMDAMPFKDGCGFCKDGTYCVCADTSLATPAMTPNDTLPPISQQVQTPPPEESEPVSPTLAMEMTADGAVKLPRRTPASSEARGRKKKNGSCGPNGPGSCAQCQADPKSGLFCRLMAANFNRDNGGSSSGGGCCGAKGAGGGCCKSKPEKEKISLPSLPSLGLSCAEAYQTLSSHRNFEKAADDIGSWLPKLKATPRPGSIPGPPGPGRMMPIEVEAASIMSVLKDFDVRFGRGF